MSSQNVPKPKRPVCMAKNVPSSVGQNVPKQNVPDADQSFFSIMGCGNKTLIDVFIQFKSLLYLRLI